MNLGEEKYLLLTTFRRDGTPVSTAVWATTQTNEDIGFSTSSESGKVKRIKNNPRVTLQPCGVRGKVKPDSEPAWATGKLVTGGQLDSIVSSINAKYGSMVGVTKFLGRIGGFVKRTKQPYADVGVMLVLDVKPKTATLPRYMKL